MFIKVLAIICLNLAAPGTCMNEPVVNSNQEQVMNIQILQSSQRQPSADHMRKPPQGYKQE